MNAITFTKWKSPYIGENKSLMILPDDQNINVPLPVQVKSV